MISCIHGLSEMLNMVSHGQSNAIDVPFKKTVLAMLSIVIDTLLRLLLLVAFAPILQVYVLPMPFT